MIVCGQLHVDKAGWKAALKHDLKLPVTDYSEEGEESDAIYATTVEELFTVATSGDEWFDALQRKWTLNEYDAKAKVWRFSVPLHDDLWGDLEGRGAMPSSLLQLLQKTTQGESDLLILFWDVAEKITEAFCIGAQSGVAKLSLGSLQPAAVKKLVKGELSAGLAALGQSLTVAPVQAPLVTKAAAVPKKADAKKKAPAKKAR
jgi:hypothetical protein